MKKNGFIVAAALAAAVVIASGAACATAGDPLKRSLQLTLGAPDEVRLGQVADLVLTVRNRSQQPLALWHARKPYDFVLTGEDGQEVWRWSRWLDFTDERAEPVLKPGEALEYRAAWDLHDQECTPDEIIPAGGADVASGQYDFAHLYDWRVQLRRSILTVGGVEFMIGINNKTNRVAVFLLEGDEFREHRELVLSHMDRLGIPHDAVEFHTMGPMRDETDFKPGVVGQPCKGNLVAPGKYLVRATFRAYLPYTNPDDATVLATGPATISVLP
ncbi:MAG: hypothetical protein HYY01_05395 [Chloroflexi bacterium]|nr:hypothetical protein [Chloroflexota bacterium]